MNFKEFTEQIAYIIIDANKNPLSDSNGKVHETMAPSAIKAKHQILHRLRSLRKTEKEWDFVRNPDNYKAVPSASMVPRFKEKDIDFPTTDSEKKPSQGELFRRRWN